MVGGERGARQPVAGQPDAAAYLDGIASSSNEHARAVDDADQRQRLPSSTYRIDCWTPRPVAVSVVFGVSLVRAPKRRRPPPRRLADPPSDVDVEAAAAGAQYVGSAEHKSFPSFAGPARLRADATPCSPTLADANELTLWLRRAISARQTSGRWEGGFLRYAWLDVDGTVYEARQLGPGSGQYKGYALSSDQRPAGLGA